MTKTSVESAARRRLSGFLWRELILLTFAGSLHAQDGTAVAARFSSVKGLVTVSTSGGEGKQGKRGDSVRSGTVISCGASGGALLKPLPTLSLVIYPDSKARYDGALVASHGGGTVNYSIITGKTLFHIDSLAQAKRAEVKVVVTTEEGLITSRTKGGPTQDSEKAPIKPSSNTATWTVQREDDRTVVAVSEGMSQVQIGTAGSDAGGLIQVPEGSVIWLFKQAEKVAAVMVDTQTGKVTQITSASVPHGDLVEQSKKLLPSPSSSGTTGTTSPPSSTPGTTPSNPPSNPDLSTPRQSLPVVSADTP